MTTHPTPVRRTPPLRRVRRVRHTAGTGVLAVLIAGLMAGSIAGCAGAGPSPADGPGTPGTTASGTLTVFAAASLKDPFTTLARDFEQSHPGTKVSLSFDGSATLATQILQGAPADVFASADLRNMAKVVDATMIDGQPAAFATNRLTIAVPVANPAAITGFADLAKPGVKVVLCAVQVPCGAAAAADEKSAGVDIAPVSEELNVTSVLGKVAAGEADAGLVYVTDVRGANGAVKSIDPHLPSPAVNTYPISAVSGSRHRDLATAFVALVTGRQGRQVLQDAGFGAP